jgi:hypothetical protein
MMIAKKTEKRRRKRNKLIMVKLTKGGTKVETKEKRKRRGR